LDLQQFDKRGADYQAYVENFENTNFECETWYKYVRLPDLHCSSKGVDPLHTVPREDARTIFNSLRDRKIKRILEVTVPDCPNHPHSDDTIINCLKEFGVKRLDWRKLDLSVKTILQAAQDVEELCLYSSGNEDMLTHWASYEGLYRLHKVHNPNPRFH
jgi:hypothetical protein